jgi:hypothetical protein
VFIAALRFTYKTASFESGAEGSRTPELRRAKLGYYHRSCSPLFKNTCKTESLALVLAVPVRGRSCGLVY